MHPSSHLEGSKLFEFLKESFRHFPNKGKVDLPREIGIGYVHKIGLFEKMTLLVVQCTLNENEIGSRNAGPYNHEYLSFSFRNILPLLEKTDSTVFPYVQLSSSNIELDISLPAHIQINNIIIGIKVDYLKELLSHGAGHEVLETILANNQPFLYEELISLNIVNLAKEIFEFTNFEILPSLYYKIKAEELIYQFFVTLLRRKESENYPLNRNDLVAVYEIRNILLRDLTICPPLENLAILANMSISKMSRSFKQIFGLSIYNYHQKIRIAEAAKLLSQKKMSVSDVGYELGFSNLSHFSRLFERYKGVKPKKYSKKD